MSQVKSVSFPPFVDDHKLKASNNKSLFPIFIAGLTIFFSPSFLSFFSLTLFLSPFFHLLTGSVFLKHTQHQINLFILSSSLLPNSFYSSISSLVYFVLSLSLLPFISLSLSFSLLAIDTLGSRVDFFLFSCFSFHSLAPRQFDVFPYSSSFSSLPIEIPKTTTTSLLFFFFLINKSPSVYACKILLFFLPSSFKSSIHLIQGMVRTTRISILFPFFPLFHSSIPSFLSPFL